MATKKSALAQGLKSFDNKKKSPLAVVPDAPAKNSARAGLQMIGSHFDPMVRRTIMMIQAETGKKLHELLGEAINDLCVKYGKVAPVVLEDR
jgi:hypothetical protein